MSTEPCNIARYLPEMAARQPDALAIALPVGRGEGGRVDYRRVSYRELDEKLVTLLDKRLFIIVGEEDRTVVNTDCPWQGSNTLERARNYVEAMRGEHQRHIQRGMRPPAGPFRFELHVLPGVGHDSAAGASKAIELLFPS